MRKKIILASASPRRKELLSQIGVTFEIIKAEKEEHITSSIPTEVVKELSMQKIKGMYKKREDEKKNVLVDVKGMYDLKTFSASDLLYWRL